jgi:hypothetical protein
MQLPAAVHHAASVPRPYLSPDDDDAAAAAAAEPPVVPAAPRPGSAKTMGLNRKLNDRRGQALGHVLGMGLDATHVHCTLFGKHAAWSFCSR